MKMSTEDNPPSPPNVGEELNHILLKQAELFGISDILSNEADPNNSTIVHPGHASTLHGWLKEDGSDGNFELLYRSSRDGLSAKDFHSSCDNKGSTITIIKTTDGRIIGGYSSTSWNSGGVVRRRTQSRDMRSHVRDARVTSQNASSKSFLFSINHNEKMKLKNPITPNAILNSSVLGPTFGSSDRGIFATDADKRLKKGYDLSVDGNIVDFNPGGSYQVSDSMTGLTTECTIKEIEVFKVREDIVFELPTTSTSTISSINETRSFAKGINEALNVKLGVLMDAEKEIFGLEKRLEDHEKFIDFFCTGETKDVITLNVSGTLMTTKRSTLRVFEESVLACQFDDTTWTDQNGCKVKEWTPTEIYKWVGKIEGIPDTVAVLFKENDITGRELLALSIEGLKMIGIERAGTLCLLLEEIKKLRQDNLDTAPFFEQSPYCFGKLIDYLRLLNLHSPGHVMETPLPQLPLVRDTEKDRFERVVHYFFPGDTCIGCCCCHE